MDESISHLYILSNFLNLIVSLNYVIIVSDAGNTKYACQNKNERKIMVARPVWSTAPQRREFRKWWFQNGAPKEYVYVYNDGHNLFVGNEYPPGVFIETPLKKWMPIGHIDFGHLWICYGGFEAPYGIYPWNAKVTACTSGHTTTVVIPGGHIVYFLTPRRGELCYREDILPLPRRLVPRR